MLRNMLSCRSVAFILCTPFGFGGKFTTERGMTEVALSSASNSRSTNDAVSVPSEGRSWPPGEMGEACAACAAERASSTDWQTVIETIVTIQAMSRPTEHAPVGEIG